jgi:hypothetical protein
MLCLCYIVHFLVILFIELSCRVIIAHCASLGKAADLDNPGSDPVSCFQLFLRLMAEPQWEGLLFGDISATCLVSRMSCVRTLLDTPALHSRLVNGSDYPLVNMAIINLTMPFYAAGMITYAERTQLNELYRVNPLLYDFVLKRTIRGTGGSRFPASMFLRNTALW